MLSLKYYGIVHKLDRIDYVHSLRMYQEIDKNDFRHQLYAVRMKPTEPSDLQEFRPSGAAISKFDDKEEIVLERKRRQPRRRDEDTKMIEADPSESPEELQTIDVSLQLFLTSKRTQVEEQLQLTRGVYLGGAILLALAKTVNAAQTLVYGAMVKTMTEIAEELQRLRMRMRILRLRKLRLQRLREDTRESRQYRQAPASFVNFIS